jgi:tartrate dehydratase beta subunit/fumarate hydratase class I family protein
MIEHTPLPWSQDGPYITAQVEDGRPGGEVILQCGPTAFSRRGKIPNKANAKFIVCACNCHDELVEACKQAKELTEKILFGTAISTKEISNVEDLLNKALDLAEEIGE